MKKLNDMELDMVNGGYLDAGGTVSDAEYELFEDIVTGIGNAVSDGYNILKYIIFR